MIPERPGAYEIPSWRLAQWWREKQPIDERCYCGQCEAPGVCVMAPREGAK